MKKIALWYIHNNDTDYLYPSLITQSPLVDKIVILDNTPDHIFKEQKMEEKILSINPQKIILKHTLEFGSGFHGEYNLPQFDEMKARNAAIELAKQTNPDWLVQCDADEWYSPSFFDFLKETKPSAIYIPEVVWINKKEYCIWDYHHLRAVHNSLPFKFVYSPIVLFNEKNKSMHCQQRVIGNFVKIDNYWHNHMHYCMGHKKDLQFISSHKKRSDIASDMLFKGEWIEPYKSLLV